MIIDESRSTRVRTQFTICACAVGLAMLGVATLGCGAGDEVRVLKVPKEPRLAVQVPPRPSAQPAGATASGATPDTPTANDASASDAMPFKARMLAAMVPREDRVWFFKMIGSTEDVQPRRGEFRKLIESITFDDDNEPQWTLPETWSEEIGRGMRKATIKAGPAAKAPSISVIGLSAPQEVLSNLNRWRDQLQQPPITEDELEEHSDTLDVDGSQAVLADISGSVDPQAVGPMAGGRMSGRMSGGPFSGGRTMPATPPGMPNPHTKAGGGPANPTVGKLKFDKPEAWVQAAATGMRKAAFSIAEDGEKAEVTIITLPPKAGDVLANVNFWRGQLGLSQLNASEIDSAARPMQISKLAGHFVEYMESDEGLQATIAAMVPYDGAIWFFKITGDGALVKRNQASFEKFVGSIEFGG